MSTQHATLTEERWRRFSLDQQILMIGNEMNRCRKLMGNADLDARRGCYERALRLTDLTVRVNRRPALWRELLRWRDVIAELYLDERPQAGQHDAAFRCLLNLTPLAHQQVALLFP